MADIAPEKIDAVLKGINSAMKGKKLYPAGHPAITAPINKTYTALSELLTTNAKIFIGMSKDVVVFEEHPIMDAEKNLGELILQIKQKEIEGIIFEKGMLLKEFTAFIDIISKEDSLKGAELQNVVASQNIMHISIKSIAKRNILETYNDAVNIVKETINQLRVGKIPQSGDIVTVVEEMHDLILTDKSAMVGLTMIKNYDHYLFNHSVNVSILSVALGQAMNCGADDLHIIGVAGLLHDLGKTGVAEDIINKPGVLSNEEWETIKQHPILGSKITEKMGGITDLVGRLIYEHHVRYDQTGYPRSGSPPHPFSLILTTADTYDALTTLRVYQKPYNPVEAIRIMNSLSGKHFDPNTLKAFISMVGVYPVGTVVRLSTNDIGVVTMVNTANSLTPVVKIIRENNGKQVEKPYKIDLSKKSSNIPIIVGTVDPLTIGLDMGAFFEEETKTVIIEQNKM